MHSTLIILRTIDEDDCEHRSHYVVPVLRKAAERMAELESILRAILDADERGQGLPFAEAMERAHRAMTPELAKG